MIPFHSTHYITANAVGLRIQAAKAFQPQTRQTEAVVVPNPAARTNNSPPLCGQPVQRWDNLPPGRRRTDGLRVGGCFQSRPVARFLLRMGQPVDDSPREKLCAMPNGVKTRFAGLLRELLRRFDENETGADTPQPPRPVTRSRTAAARARSANVPRLSQNRLRVPQPPHRRQPKISTKWNCRCKPSWETCRRNCTPG